MIFISSPYGHPDNQIQEYRYWATCQYGANLMLEGKLAISPLILGHTYIRHAPMLPDHFEFWKVFSLEILRRCTEVHVLAFLNGWELSKGVEAETKFATSLGIPINFIYKVNW